MSYHSLPEDTNEADLLSLVDQLNHDDQVHGILVQLPLPKHISTQTILSSFNPPKDVDGFHPKNIGLLIQNLPPPACAPLPAS